MTNIPLETTGGAQRKANRETLFRRLGGNQRVRDRADMTLMGTPPVRTQVIGSPPADPANSRFYPYNSPLLRISGARMVPNVFGTTAPGTVSANGLVTSTGTTSTDVATLQAGRPYRLEFVLDGTSFTVPLGSPLAASPKARLFVDNQLATADQELLTGGGGADYWTNHTWTFPDARPRKICLELVNAAIKGVWVPNTAGLLPIPWPQGPKVLWVGDSISESAIATSAFLGYAHIASWLLGLDNYAVSAVGSTGYLNNVSATKKNALERIQADVIADAPDAVIWFLGTNDVAMDVPSLQANAGGCYDAVKAALPDCQQIVFGPMYINPPATGFTATRDAIASTAASRGLPFIDTYAADRWLWGTGNAGDGLGGGPPNPVGDGNADRYSGGAGTSQSVHPVNVGHKSLGYWTAGKAAPSLLIPPPVA